ncbi:Hypothetical predicted protein [Podarcis lilfordi]|uniref:Uncharacterized protein n=1 Tax=Podarcis lilfordi TaxID=74358 RepID=A0AA35P8B6_9SAUR|nr:Hypothetical predicted protein [Podarcis lilfordi]
MIILGSFTIWLMNDQKKQRFFLQLQRPRRCREESLSGTAGLAVGQDFFLLPPPSAERRAESPGGSEGFARSAPGLHPRAARGHVLRAKRRGEERGGGACLALGSARPARRSIHLAAGARARSAPDALPPAGPGSGRRGPQRPGARRRVRVGLGWAGLRPPAARRPRVLSLAARPAAGRC